MKKKSDLKDDDDHTFFQWSSRNTSNNTGKIEAIWFLLGVEHLKLYLPHLASFGSTELWTKNDDVAEEESLIVSSGYL